MYSIHMTDGTSETSSEIRARLNPSIVTEARYIARIDEIERSGIRYSNEDFDVLSGARAAIHRRETCDRLNLSRHCGPNELWLAIARDRMRDLASKG